MGASQQMMFISFFDSAPSTITLPSGAVIAGTGIWLDASDLSTMWQDASKTTPVSADGHLVRVMTDKSGYAHETSAASDASRPTYKTSGGLHWLNFAGKALNLSTFSAMSNKPAFTKIIGIEPTNIAGNRVTDSVGSASLVQLNTYLRGYASAGVAGEVSPMPVSANNKYVVSLIFDGSLPATHADRLKMRINGAPITWTATAGTIGSTTGPGTALILGAASTNGAVAAWVGNIFQYLMIDKALSDTERDAEEDAIAAKMGISL